jgi:transcriptional regulator with XRE-family HTH domain
MANREKSTRSKPTAELRPLLEKRVGPLSLGKLLESIRLGEEWTMEEMAKKLAITRSALNDIEKGRKNLSVDRAAKYAKILGFSETQFVRLALQAQVDRAGLGYQVDVIAA